MFLRRLAERSDKLLMTGDFSYRGFFDSAIEGIFRHADGQHLDVNPALRGSTATKIRSSQDSLTILRPSSMSTRRGATISKTSWRQTTSCASSAKSGSATAHHLDFGKRRAIRDWKGQIVCYQGTVEDVTARFAAERAIRRASSAPSRPTAPKTPSSR